MYLVKASKSLLKYSKAKNPNAKIYKSNINNPELADQNYDLVTILDVLYTTGFENSVTGLIKISTTVLIKYYYPEEKDFYLSNLNFHNS